MQIKLSPRSARLRLMGLFLRTEKLPPVREVEASRYYQRYANCLRIRGLVVEGKAKRSLHRLLKPGKHWGHLWEVGSQAFPHPLRGYMVSDSLAWSCSCVKGPKSLQERRELHPQRNCCSKSPPSPTEELVGVSGCFPDTHSLFSHQNDLNFLLEVHCSFILSTLGGIPSGGLILLAVVRGSGVGSCQPKAIRYLETFAGASKNLKPPSSCVEIAWVDTPAG